MTDHSTRRRFTLGLLAFALLGAGENRAEAARRKSGRGRKPRSRVSAGSRASSAGGWSSCREARAAGRRGIREGDADYSRRLDRDGDGRACE